MSYLVFDCRKASGYLFETRHKWLARGFCIVASWFGDWRWDWSATMDFTPWTEAESKPWVGEEADLVRAVMREEAERDWREVYGS